MSYTGFDKLKAQLANRPGVTNPGGLAASIGREKYGPQAMSHAAATGHSLKGHKTKKRGRHQQPTVADRHAALSRYMRQH